MEAAKRHRVVFFYRQDCHVCDTTYRNLTISGADMQIAKVCVDDHPILRGKQSVPALFVSDSKQMHVGPNAILEYIRSAMMDEHMSSMRNQAQSCGGGGHHQLQQPQPQPQPQPQQLQLQQRGVGGGVGGPQPPPPLQNQTTSEPSAADWTPSDGQAYSWLSGDEGSRLRMGINYEDDSVWAVPQANPADSDVPGRGRSATGIGGAPERMMPPQPQPSSSSSISVEHLEELRRNEASAWGTSK